MVALRFFGKQKNKKNRNSSEATEGAAAPAHVAIIMDGNNRWAKKNLAPGKSGHSVGAESIRKVLKVCQQRGVGVLTLFAFSSENWNRPKDEVAELMGLLRRYLEKETPALHEQGVRLRFIGRRDRLAPDIVAKMVESEQLTSANRDNTLVLALDFGGRWDISQAAQQLAAAVAKGELAVEDIDEQRFAGYLSLADLPTPDLCIRTGAEHRISNFLLWDCAYAELYFTDCFWPEFDEKEFGAALDDYARRQRRFGLTSEQVEATAGASTPAARS